MLSELRTRHKNSILNRLLLKNSFHCLLWFLFVTFLIQWPLHLACSWVYLCWSCFVCSRLTYEIYSCGGPSTYIYCVVCYLMIAALCDRNIGGIFSPLYSCWWSRMSLENVLSFLTKVVFPIGSLQPKYMHLTMVLFG